ncbi:MAG: hypothetical protein C4542_00425 [Dehalococcoidia bacterium]|nr:MAG: hypothetical protein C4542_00425 [Dehalococcoidia bacterium]
MRDFNENDKKKKQTRIQPKENLGDLSREILSQLEDSVKASLKDSYLPCAVALKIAQDVNVPQTAVGMMADKLGIRITNCQIGCFKVDKNVHENLEPKRIDNKVIATLETLRNKNELTCANVFEVAQKLKISPMAISDIANSQNLKIHLCQLGCF